MGLVKPCWLAGGHGLPQGSLNQSKVQDLLPLFSQAFGPGTDWPPHSKEHQHGCDVLLSRRVRKAQGRGLEAGPKGSGWWLLWQALLQPSPAHQVMSNRANINVNVLLSVVKSVFVVLQFIFSLPALWMLSADMSGWYPLPKIHALSTFLRSWAFPPSLWHADVKFLPGSVIHKTLHTYQIMSLTFQGQKLSVSVRHRVDVQAWFGVGAKGGRALLSFFGMFFLKKIQPYRNRCV